MYTTREQSGTWVLSYTVCSSVLETLLEANYTQVQLGGEPRSLSTDLKSPPFQLLPLQMASFPGIPTRKMGCSPPSTVAQFLQLDLPWGEATREQRQRNSEESQPSLGGQEPLP